MCFFTFKGEDSRYQSQQKSKSRQKSNSKPKSKANTNQLIRGYFNFFNFNINFFYNLCISYLNYLLLAFMISLVSNIIYLSLYLVSLI